MEPKAYSYIRFSTPEQALGDSLRRQIAEAEAYAKKHGLTLDDSMRDKGLSAYKGMHRTKGTLGEFLHRVNTGQIARGSLFIVEDLDRLSREPVSDALPQFMSIINAGIKVVTLQDGIEYDQESINQKMGGPLIISIFKMALAHDESEKKAIRLRAAWEQKRNIIQEKKLTAKAPAWLESYKVKDKTEFRLIPEAQRAIELIYRKRLAGKGAARIETEMVADPDVWKPEKRGPKKTGGWRKSYIVKILRSRAVIGEFQPCKMVNDKAQPIGDPIPDYFPPAISEELFYQVQDIQRANGAMKGNAGGRTGKASNLFTHVVKCGICGSPMHFVDKGKGLQYLHCDRARRLKECPAKTVRYDEFEHLFFENFEELDISSLIPGKDETQARVTELEALLAVNRQRITGLAEDIGRFSEAMRTSKQPQAVKHFTELVDRAYEDKALLESENQGYDRELTQLRQEKSTLTQDVEQAKEIYALLDSCQSEQERIDLRFRLRQQIGKMIEWIKVYPLQDETEGPHLLPPLDETKRNTLGFKIAHNARKQLMTMEQPKVLPGQEGRQVQETEEPGIVKWMNSRYLDRVRIKFRGSGNLRVLYLKGYAEVVSGN